MYAKEKNSSSLATTICSYDYTLIDTSSLMDENFPEFMDNLTEAKSYFRKEDRVLILEQCIEELKKHEKDKENAAKLIAAKRALKIIRHARFKHLVKVIKFESNNLSNFADNAIYLKVSEDRLHKKVLIITQDKHLAYDLRSLNQLASQKGKDLEVLCLEVDGKLIINVGKKDISKTERKVLSALPKKALFKKEPRKKEVKKAKVDYSVKISQLQASEKILNANLNNPNYPKDSKIKSINEHLSILRSIPKQEIEKLHLILSEKDLLDEYSRLKNIKDVVEEKKIDPLLNKYLGKGNRIDSAIADTISKLGYKLIEDDSKYSLVLNGSTQFKKENITKLGNEIAKSIVIGKPLTKVVNEVSYEVYKVSSSDYRVNIKIAPVEEKVKAKPLKPKKVTTPLDSALKGEKKLKKVLSDEASTSEIKVKAIRLQLKKIKVLNEEDLKKVSFDSNYLNELINQLSK